MSQISKVPSPNRHRDGELLVTFPVTDTVIDVADLK